METLPQTIQESNFDLPTKEQAARKLAAIREFQSLVRETFKEGHDYGTIPGTPKPTLYKPGAEKTAKLLSLSDHYEVTQRVEDWDKPFFFYEVRCSLKVMGTDSVFSEGLGSCNSMESKYRYRWIYKSEAEDLGIDVSKLRKKTFKGKSGSYVKYQVENEDIYSQVNTVLKMAKKRALVDAALSAGRLSDLFTQDAEDLADENDEQQQEPQSTINPPQQKQPDQASGNGKNEPPPANDAMVLIDSVTKKDGTNKNGPWVKYGVRVGNEWYSTFSEALGKEAERAYNAKLPVVIDWHQEGEYKNITNIQVIEK